jgi:hypothetical protein
LIVLAYGRHIALKKEEETQAESREAVPLKAESTCVLLIEKLCVFLPWLTDRTSIWPVCCLEKMKRKKNTTDLPLFSHYLLCYE